MHHLSPTPTARATVQYAGLPRHAKQIVLENQNIYQKTQNISKPNKFTKPLNIGIFSFSIQAIQRGTEPGFQ